MIIYGKNPVIEALLGMPSQVEEVLISQEGKGERYSEIIKLARENKVKISFLPQKALSKISDTPGHQGVLARIRDYEYAPLDQILGRAKGKGEKPLLLILDHIEDPQNLGAMIRTVNVLGAHGVVIPKDRSASVTPAVIKASAGATSFIPVARVINIVSVMKELKKNGLWIVGADQSAPKAVFEENLGKLDLALVIGSEGKGLGRLVREECDFLVSIPGVGEVSSLNASVAAGIIIYEVMRQRRSIQNISQE
jgi:23S rRNA (guanosine2251-2'-O)-methyltransferase